MDQGIDVPRFLMPLDPQRQHGNRLVEHARIPVVRGQFQVRLRFVTQDIFQVLPGVLSSEACLERSREEIALTIRHKVRGILLQHLGEATGRLFLFPLFPQS